MSRLTHEWIEGIGSVPISKPAPVNGCQHCNSARVMCFPVTCDRCGKKGCSNSMVMEEGDEWECPPCNERENRREQNEG